MYNCHKYLNHNKNMQIFNKEAQKGMEQHVNAEYLTSLFLYCSDNKHHFGCLCNQISTE